MKSHFMLCLLLLTGCGLDGPVPSGPKREVATPTPVPQTVPAQPATGATNTGKATAETKPSTVREKAAVGMGEQGRGYGHNMITVALGAYWNAKQMIVLDQIRHALDLYKGLNDGKGPKTHKEFMEKIIKENNLQLPTLPTGCSYVYEPSTEELMVEKPNNL